MAALPTLSAQFALGKMDDLRNSLATSLRGILLLSIPASLGMILLRQPIVALMLQYGKFTEASTQLISWALLWYSAGLVGHCIVEILARAFYAMHDTKTPVLVGSVAMGLNVVFSCALLQLVCSHWLDAPWWAGVGEFAGDGAGGCQSIDIDAPQAGWVGRAAHSEGYQSSNFATVVMVAGALGLAGY